MRTILTPRQLSRLTDLYTEPFRVYHNLEHITILFQLASAHGVRLSVPQQLAIWYHDAIYIPMAGAESELKSANFMKSELQANCWLSNNLVERAYNMIIATKTHRSYDHETQIVLDLDLAGLGFDSETYYSNVCKIRTEYSHLSDDVWRSNRIIFLKNMLGRDHIFYTAWGRDYYEKTARRNMQTELDQLIKVENEKN